MMAYSIEFKEQRGNSKWVNLVFDTGERVPLKGKMFGHEFKRCRYHLAYNVFERRWAKGLELAAVMENGVFKYAEQDIIERVFEFANEEM